MIVNRVLWSFSCGEMSSEPTFIGHCMKEVCFKPLAGYPEGFHGCPHVIQERSKILLQKI
jgi:hypothetical protein